MSEEPLSTAQDEVGHELKDAMIELTSASRNGLKTHGIVTIMHLAIRSESALNNRSNEQQCVRPRSRGRFLQVPACQTTLHPLG